MSTIILYLDTSANVATYMLMNEQQVLAKEIHNVQNEHGQTINLLIETMLIKCGITMKDLNGVAVLNGPGSYTGLRISLATAKGICFACSIPLILLNKLNVMQAMKNATIQANMASCIKAREGEYYAAFYDSNGHPFIEPTLLLANEFLEYLHHYSATVITFASDEFALFHSRQLIANLDENTIHKVIFSHFQSSHFADLFQSEPFYMKNVHINKINKL
jgi:tRNA threonylcarbamoyladenosine biosynthesis protein TsaB